MTEKDEAVNESPKKVDLSECGRPGWCWFCDSEEESEPEIDNVTDREIAKQCEVHRE